MRQIWRDFILIISSSRRYTRLCFDLIDRIITSAAVVTIAQDFQEAPSLFYVSATMLLIDHFSGRVGGSP